MRPSARPVTAPVFAAAFTLGLAGPALAGGSPQGQVYDLRTIALTGNTAPGLAAGSFVTFDLPSINASGQVAFAAITDGALVNEGIWATRLSDPATLRIIMGDDLFPPDAPAGVRYAEFDSLSFVHPHLADDGTIDFWAHLDGYGDGETRSGHFEFDGATTRSVVQPGDAVNGIAGATIASVSNIQSSSDSSLAGFRGTIEGPGIDATNDSVLLVEWFGGLTPIVREGAAAPGLGGHTWRPWSSFGNPQLGPSGLMTFPAIVDDGGGPLDALYQGFPGVFEPILVEGDVFPGAGPFTGFGSYVHFSANGDGEVAMSASFEDGGETQRGIFRISDGVRTTVARTNGAGPIGTYEGSAAAFQFQAPPQIADDGTITFAARFAEPSDETDTAILRQRPGQAAEVVLREGDAAYGYWGGVVFEDFDGIAGVPAIDRTGRIYVNAVVRGPAINGTNNVGIWSIDPDGSVNLVVRGQMGITVAPWDTRYVDEVRFWLGGSMSAGQRPGINDRGDVAFRVIFTDGSQAIMHGHLPPSCPADRNDDGVIDFDDLLIVLATFDQTFPVGDGGDADWDGDVDFDDLLIVLGAFGTNCNPF